MATERLARAVLEITTDDSGLNRGLDAAGDKVKSVGGKLSGIGKSLLPVSALFAGVGFAAVKMATDMNAAMANVATLIPGNTARVAELKAGVQDLAIATGKSTGDLTEGLYQTVSAFGDTADSMKILNINARAAAAGVATTLDAINLTSAVTKGYGDTSAAAVQQVSDLAFQAVKLGQTTFPELAASIGRVTPLAAELKVSQQELFGVMATGTGVTGTASEVSTQLRGVLQSLMAPTADMANLLGDLGVASGKALLEQQGLQGTINTIVQAAEAAGVPLQKFIGSIEGQTLALALAGPQADVFTEKLAAMQDAAGATDQAFAEQTEGVNAAGFAWAQLQQTMAVNAQKLGDAILPVLMNVAKSLEPVVDWVSRAIDWFSQLPAPVQTVGVAIGAVVAAAGPLLLAIGSIVSAIGTAMPVISAIGAAIATVATGPVALIVGALIGLAAVWIKWGDDITAVVSSTVGAVVNWLGPKLAVVWKPIEGLLTSIMKLHEAFQRLVLAVLVKVVGAVAEAVADIVGWLQDKLAPVFRFLEPIVTAIGTVFEHVWRKSVAAAKALYEGVKTWLLDRFTGIIDGIKRKIDAVTGFFENMYEAVVGGSFVPDMVTEIGEHFNRLDRVMVDPAKIGTGEVVDSFDSMARRSIDVVRDGLDRIGEKISGWFGSSGFGGTIGGLVGGLFGSITGGLLSGLDGLIAQGIDWLAGKLLDGLKSIGRAIGNFFKGLFSVGPVTPEEAFDQWRDRFDSGEGEFPLPPEEGGPDLPPDFFGDPVPMNFGTPRLDFMNFGRRTPAELHNEEAIIPRGRGHELAGEIAGALAPLLERDAGAETGGTVNINLAGQRVATILLPELVRALKHNDSGGRPRSDLSELRAVLAGVGA